MNTLLAALTPAFLIGPVISGIIGGTLYAVIMRWKSLRTLRAAAADPMQIARATAWPTYILQGIGMAIFMVVMLITMRLLGY